jgi:hypothetical protein
MAQKKISEKMEFSKKILTASYVLVFMTIGVMFTVALMGGDAASFSQIVLATIVELSTINAFYLWKARSENKLKIAMSVTDDQIEHLKAIKDILP